MNNYEMKFDCEGLAGTALKMMRENGWVMITDFKCANFLGTDEIMTVNVSGNLKLLKHGKPMPKEVWDAELEQVWTKLNLIQNPFPK